MAFSDCLFDIFSWRLIMVWGGPADQAQFRQAFLEFDLVIKGLLWWEFLEFFGEEILEFLEHFNDCRVVAREAVLFGFVYDLDVVPHKRDFLGV